MAAHRGRALGLVLLLSIISASACTVCDSEKGQQVRVGIFGDEFWTTLVGVIAPFPVLLIVIAAYHYGTPSFWARSSLGGRASDGERGS